MARTIKIFCFPTHCSKTVTPGVDYVRLILPMKELAKDKRFKVHFYTNTLKKPLTWRDWDRYAQEYDILYINYLTLPWDFSLVGMLFRKYKKKIVLDIDDLIWEIQGDNSSYSTYALGSEGRAVVTDICREVDFITCTNSYLKNGIAHYTQKRHEKIVVLPNYIDLKLYTWRAKLRIAPTVRIGYFGSSSHFNDLGERNFIAGIEKLMLEYPNVELYTIGAMIQQFKKKFGMRYTTAFGHQNLYTWVTMMPEKLGKVDIFAVPLVDSPYSKAKSGIKFLEMSSTMKPGVYQDIRQYQELVNHGKNGFLASTAEEWYTCLKTLVDSVDLREKMGWAAFQTVFDLWQMEDNVKRYVAFFQLVFDSPVKEEYSVFVTNV